MERIYSQDNYNISYKRFSAPRKRPGRPPAQNNELPVNCFVCDQKLTRLKGNLMLGSSSSNRRGFPSQISQLLGEEFFVIVKKDDYLCKQCVTLFNNMDKLEKQLSVVKDTLLTYLRKKYDLDNTNNKINKLEEESMEYDNLKDDEIAKQLNELYSEENEKSTLLTCIKCNFNTHDENELIKHKAIHISSSFKSQFTDNSNSALGDDEFYSNTSPVQVKLYKCSFCFKIFTSRFECLQHMKANHVSDKQLMQDNNINSSSYNSRNDEIFNSLKNEGDKVARKFIFRNSLFHCNSCSAPFKDHSGFVEHKCDFSTFNECNQPHNSNSNFSQNHPKILKDDDVKNSDSFLLKRDKKGDSTCSSLGTFQLNNGSSKGGDIEDNMNCEKSLDKCLHENKSDSKNTFDHTGDENIVSGEVHYASDYDSKNESTDDEYEDSDGTYDSGDEPRKHLCGICGFNSDVSSLREHFKIRSQRDLVCSVCGQSFDSFCKLMKHSLGHDINSKPYYCIYCSDLKVPDLLSLNYHMKKKHLNLIDEKLCNTCKRIFPNLDYLEKHILDKNDCIQVSKGESDEIYVSVPESIDKNSTPNELEATEMKRISEIVQESDSVDDCKPQSTPFSSVNKIPDPLNVVNDINESHCQANVLSVDYKNSDQIGLFDHFGGNPVEIHNNVKEIPETLPLLSDVNKIKNNLNSTVSLKRKLNDLNVSFESNNIPAKSPKISCGVDQSNCKHLNSLFVCSEKAEHSINVEDVYTSHCESGGLEKNSNSPMETLESVEYLNDQVAVMVVYKCTVCGLQRDTNEDLLIHTQEHNDVDFKPKSCDVCCIVQDDYQLKTHENKHNVVSHNRLCLYCGKTLLDDLILKGHIIQNHSVDIANLYCTLCDSTFDGNIDFKRHLATHLSKVSNENYFCKKCDKNYYFKRKLLKHYSKYHKMEVQCRFCNLVMRDSENLYKHEPLHIKNQSELKCFVCHRLCRNYASLKFHESIHSSDLNLCCDICELSFSSVNIFNNHMIEKHCDESDLFKCRICDRSFRNYFSFKIHRIYFHKNIKFLYECKLCHMRFSSSSLRAIHKAKFHKDQYLFSCNVCYTFNTFKLANYKNHMYFHFKKFPYHCKKCLKIFTQKSFYINHKLRTHHGNKLPCFSHKKFRPNNFRGLKTGPDGKLNVIGCKLNNHSRDPISHSSSVECSNMNYQCYQSVENKTDVP